MLKLLYLLPAGIFLHTLLPTLPPRQILLAGLALAALLILASRGLRGPGILLLGFILGCLWGHRQLEHRLPVALDKSEVTVIGTVDSLVTGDSAVRRFNFRVSGLAGSEGSALPEPEILRLSWYGESSVQPGETWQLRVRLRSPRGFSNPGSFDYSGWLLSRGISATGYVRDSDLNRRLDDAPGDSLHHWRAQLLEALFRQPVAPEVAGVMAALVLGEQGFIPRERFEQFRATGTVHLIVVSGLHVGMVCGLGLLVGLGLGRVAVALGATVPARILAIPLALSAALAYSLLAGFDLPIQRSLVMSSVALFAVAARRTAHVWYLMGLALTAVALLDPVAVLGAGFWLSFVAVAGLVAWFSYRPPGRRWQRLAVAQGVVFLSLTPWLIYFQGNASLWALPVNLVAIPWVSLSIVPCCLLGALFLFLPPLSDFFWRLAAWQIELLLAAFASIERADAVMAVSPFIRLPAGSVAVLAALALLTLLLMLPRGLGRAAPVAVLAVALAAADPRPESDLEVAVLDVGQGLAAVVRAGGRVLVYDTGPGFPSGFNTGEAVVAPYLSTLGIQRVDRLIISHGDSDHAGGLAGLVSAVAVDKLMIDQPGHSPCRQGDTWHWGEVRFRVLWPSPQGARGSSDNNSSCVLLVERGGIRVLLAGDIEKSVERRLVSHYGGDGLTDLSLLLAPHHGSKTSSSAALLAATQPAHAVFSAGFNHHFGHPHPDVVARYRRIGSTLWHTAQSGALIFRWQGGELAVTEHRRRYRRYWH